MKTNKNFKEKILNQSSYWVEGINGFLYEVILDYMETNNLNRTKLAEHLGITKGRVSQILNDGEINFSIEKVIQIALKVGVFPDFKFIEKSKYLENIRSQENSISINYNHEEVTKLEPNNRNKGKVISIKQRVENKIAL